MIDSQHERIYKYAHDHGSVTVRDICTALHINSPSARLSEMRHSGAYILDSIWETGNENTARYKRYFIRKAEVSPL